MSNFGVINNNVQCERLVVLLSTPQGDRSWGTPGVRSTHKAHGIKDGAPHSSPGSPCCGVLDTWMARMERTQ